MPNNDSKNTIVQ